LKIINREEKIDLFNEKINFSFSKKAYKLSFAIAAHCSVPNGMDIHKYRYQIPYINL